MKNILILYPHWVPSNLTGVHRVRLVANSLVRKGYKVKVITVDPSYYEDVPDPNLRLLVEKGVEVIRVRAFRVFKIRLVGDLGLRGAYFLWKELKKQLKSNSFDVMWVPIPSFYGALVPLFIRAPTRPKWGVDYIDPWVRKTKGRGLREKASVLFATILEPLVIKRVDFVTGVNRSYYKPALKRNHRMGLQEASFPYGIDSMDYRDWTRMVKVNEAPCFNGKFALYAGAFLPDSVTLMRIFFEAIRHLRETGGLLIDKMVFIGTGGTSERNVKKIAQEIGIGELVEEFRERFGYLETIELQKMAVGNFIIGSGEKHYTPSKVFQNLMIGKPVFLMTHIESPVWSDIDGWQGLIGVKWERGETIDILEDVRNWIDLKELVSGPRETLEIDYLIHPLINLIEC